MFTDVQLIHLDRVDSTHTTAKEVDITAHANTVFAIIAREQTHGKGRYGKSWLSSRDESLLLTLTFQSALLPHPHQLTQVLAYTAFEFLKNLGLLSCLKWPNDIFIDDKKIGGILMDSSQHRCLVSIGLNINQPLKFFDQVDQKATSFFLETGRKMLPWQAAEVLSRLFVTHLNQWMTLGFNSFYHRINEQALYLGPAEYQQEGGESRSGKVMGLDQHGFLLFDDRGMTLTIKSGSLRILAQENP